VSIKTFGEILRNVAVELLHLADLGILIVSPVAERLQFLKPDLFKERQLITQIEIWIVRDFYCLKYLENKILGAIFVILFLQLFIAMRTNAEHKLMAVERTFKVQAASEQDLAIDNVLNLKDTCRLLSFFILSFDILN
jgi:hypothetical protein